MAYNFSFAPRFTQEAVERYPSLTSALGNHYPGISEAVSSPPPFVVDESPQLYHWHRTPFSSVQVAPYEDPQLALSQYLDDLTLATTRPLCSTSPLLLPPKFPRALAKVTRKRKTVKEYSCDRCSQRFSTGTDLRRHSSAHVGEPRFSCDFPGCLKEFGAKSNLMRHEGNVHRRSHKPDSRQSVTSDFAFMNSEDTPTPVRSDTTTPGQLTWDHDGPLVRRREFTPMVLATESGFLSDQVQPRARPRAVHRKQVVAHPILGYSLRFC
ncbi:hypothetical protein FB45DRAFT_895540 [Roridomyces roridus]|uniref:C2H2-type domain-containing protein n=1 Tax=Roridomyces roridus TaxID=1738132 RepID=A0AAD7CA25_9AGAR|nr:hypothetical protein FB45DRAFT_895540 [Roridomyces roridus]